MLRIVPGSYRPKKGRFEENFLVFERDRIQCIREWTSLTGERVKTDPAFAVTMAYANVQALASKASSQVYAQVLGERHVYSLYVLLKKVAYQLFKRGYSIETVYSWLLEAVGEEGYWWEKWAEGVEGKIVVLEIVRMLVWKAEERIACEDLMDVSRKDARNISHKDARRQRRRERRSVTIRSQRMDYKGRPAGLSKGFFDREGRMFRLLMEHSPPTQMRSLE